MTDNDFITSLEEELDFLVDECQSSYNLPIVEPNDNDSVRSYNLYNSGRAVGWNHALKSIRDCIKIYRRQNVR